MNGMWVLDPINFDEIWSSNSFKVLWRSLSGFLGRGHQ